MLTDLRTLVTGDATLAGLIGAAVYPATFPQGAPDLCLRYQLVSGSIGLHLRGSDGLSRGLVQFDARAKVAADVAAAAQALSVRDALVALLHGYAGAVGDTRFQLIALSSDRGVRFEATDTAQYYLASLDFDVLSRAAA